MGFSHLLSPKTNTHTNNRRQSSPSSKTTEMRHPAGVDVAPPPAPLRRLRIPCICGEAHASSTCPATDEPAATTCIFLPHPSTTKKAASAPAAAVTTPPPPARERQCRAAKKRPKPPTSNRRWKEFQRQARRRKLPVVMEKRHYHLLTKQPCAYCGRKTGKIGVDRVCNSEPYTAENTLPCCSVCNFMKRAILTSAPLSAQQRRFQTGPCRVSPSC